MTSTHMEPRPYQTRIVRKTLDMFAGTYRDGKGDLIPAVRSVMIESPTGSGKTYMALMIAKALQQQANARIGWVAMRRNLLEQIKAENERHGFGVELQTISMFDKNPPTDIDLLVVDECVPGDTLVDVLVDGQPHQARMDEVVLRGVGSAVLSRSDGGELEYQRIVSRTPMGRKELLEVIIDTEEGQQILLITEEGRVWTEAGYRRPMELLGSTVLCKSSRCQTYLYGQRTTESPGTVRGNSTGDGTECSPMCLRLRPAGSMVPLHEEVQAVPLQPSPAARVGAADSETTADYARDDAGRRVRQLRPQPTDGRADQCSLAYPAFDAAATRVRQVVARDPAAAERNIPDSGEQGLWPGSGRVQHALAPVHFRGGSADLPTAEVHHAEFPGPLGRTGLRGVVDGRRIDGVAGNARLHGPRERDHRRLAAGAVGNCCQHQHGPAGAEALPVVSPAERRDAAAPGGSACDSVAVVQVRAIPADALVRGTVVAVRRTGRCVETYDIGVAKNHNFFADGVLIHNCQHDAASSCAHLHNVIRPRWILGLTATPFRMDHVKLCFDAVVKDAGIHQLIQDGYLSRFDHYTIPKWEVSQLADFYCAEPSRWGKSIFYFHSIEECRRLNAMLRERGIASDVVTGSTDRERQLAAFRAGGLQVLINCMVLSEGFDDPTLQTVWVRPSGRGPTIQMAGRVLRRCGDAIKQVIQCRQTRHPFAKTATPQQSYLWQSGQWRSLTMNPKLNLCNHNVRLAIAGTVVALPKFLDRKRIRPRRGRR